MTELPDNATGDALRRILYAGSDLSKPLEMDFFMAVPSEDAGNRVAKMAQQIGFTTKVERDEETSEWTCYCTKTIVPDYAEVVKMEETLDAIAKPFGGYIDGFGSFGNADE